MRRIETLDDALTEALIDVQATTLSMHLVRVTFGKFAPKVNMTDKFYWVCSYTQTHGNTVDQPQKEDDSVERVRKVIAAHAEFRDRMPEVSGDE